MNGHGDLDAALAAMLSDAGCDAVFEVLHEYVDEQLSGADPAQSNTGVATHLLTCAACREDYVGLIEAAEKFGDANPETAPS